MISFFNGKRVLVTGGAGFIGSNLIKKILPLGAKIRATTYKTKPQIIDRRIDYVKVDLTRKNDCQKIIKGIDYLFMCAANSSGAAVIENSPLSHVTPNILMNTLVLEASYEAKVKKFLFISSNAVYPPFNHPVKEDEMMKGQPFEKYYPVAWMKRYSEILCEIYATKIKNPMKVIVVRPANTFGPYDDFDFQTSHVIPSLIRKVVEKNNPLEVWGDGKDIKDLIYVEDLAEGILLAMSKMQSFDQINIGTGRPISVINALKIILKLSGAEKTKIVFNKSKPTMIPRRILNINHAKNVLGFTAKTSFESGILKTIHWYNNTLKKN